MWNRNRENLIFYFPLFYCFQFIPKNPQVKIHKNKSLMHEILLNKHLKIHILEIFLIYDAKENEFMIFTEYFCQLFSTSQTWTAMNYFTPHLHKNEQNIFENIRILIFAWIYLHVNLIAPLLSSSLLVFSSQGFAFSSFCCLFNRWHIYTNFPVFCFSKIFSICCSVFSSFLPIYS